MPAIPSILRLPPQKVFLILASVFGLLLLILVPPFQVPDEDDHFFRAWQIAEGKLTSDMKELRIGGELPASLDSVTKLFEARRYALPMNMPFSLFRQAAAIPAEPDKRIFIDFNNTAPYPFFCYLPQSTGILIMRLFGCAPLACFYAGRFLALLTWLFCGYTAIRLMPFCKWLLTFMTLLPMSVFVNMSVSADVVTNCMVFLFISYILKISRPGELVTRERLLKLFALVIGLCSAKMAYVPVLLLLLLIPASGFGGMARKLGWCAALAISGGVIVLAWYSIADGLYLNWDQYDANYRQKATLAWGADVDKQAAYLFSGFDTFFSVLWFSLLSCGGNHVESYIGLFGWLNVPINPYLNAACYLGIYVVAFTDGGAPGFMKRERLILFSTFVLIVISVIISLYVSWHKIAVPGVVFIQGRYLIPCYPLFFMALQGLMPRKHVAPLLTWSMVLALSCTVVVFLENYYIV